MAENYHAEAELLTFVCDKCGECCRHIESFIAAWPHQRNGVCNFLEGDLCAIYADRPDVCDYKRAYKFFESYLSEDEYRKMIIDACEKIKKPPQ